MTKTLTEQWREGTLPDGEYYVKDWDGKIDWFVAQNKILWRDNNNPMYTSERIEILAPVPDYGSLYNPNDGRVPVGLFTVLKLIKRDIERTQEYRHLTDLECGIKSQVVSLLKRRGWDLGKDGLVSNSDELSRKTLQLEKKLEVALEVLGIIAMHSKDTVDAVQAACAISQIKEMEGVK